MVKTPNRHHLKLNLAWNCDYLNLSGE